MKIKIYSGTPFRGDHITFVHHFEHHFWTSLLNVTFIQTFWMSLLGMIFGHDFWTSLLKIHNFWTYVTFIQL